MMPADPKALLIYILAAVAGLAAAGVERRFTRWPVVGALLVAAIIGGLLTIKASPFTFAGGDWYFEGMIAAILAAVALAGYVVGHAGMWALKGRSA